LSVPAAQAETAALLHRLSGAAPVETHISLVYRGADTVWKLKKAVRLPFLDFTQADARRRFAERELALNGHAAPGLYRDVVAVRRSAGGGLFLATGMADAADRPVVDWVVRMARVPDADFLDARAARDGELDDDLLTALGDAVAAYHDGLTSLTEVDAAAAMAKAVVGNADSAMAAGLPKTAVREWCRNVQAALRGIGGWQSARRKAGFVRRAHGDLHLGNLCLWRGRPALFDALEFDEDLARIDVAYDLAFLVMDLDRRVGRAAANQLLNRYVARTGDAGLVGGLPPFLSLRAMIRAHVAARRGMADEAQDYLAAAGSYLTPPLPTLVGIGGLQGAGKSTIARALARTGWRMRQAWLIVR
jgi:aminoglycoside phosphotransferase family enzyme